MVFHLGDKVRIKKGTQFASQSTVSGKIIDIGGGQWIEVLFVNGYRNSYPKDDLEMTRITNWKKELGG